MKKSNLIRLLLIVVLIGSFIIGAFIIYGTNLQTQSLITPVRSSNLVFDTIQLGEDASYFKSQVGISPNRDPLYCSLVVATKFNGEWVSLHDLTAYRNTATEIDLIDISNVKDGIYNVDYFYISNCKSNQDIDRLPTYSSSGSSEKVVFEYKTPAYSNLVKGIRPRHYAYDFEVGQDLDKNYPAIETITYRQLLDKNVNSINWNVHTERVVVASKIKEVTTPVDNSMNDDLTIYQKFIKWLNSVIYQ